MIDLAGFEASLKGETPPDGLSRPLRALWHAGKGDWDRAHGIVQEDEASADCAWVHAYLHRVEGDRANAAYWYRRAARTAPGGDLQAEWRAIAGALLGKG